MAEEAISATKLHAISQRGGEPARDYIRWWMNVCRKHKQPLSEEEANNICKNNMQKEILNRMGDIGIRTFDRLNNVATDIEAFLAKYSSADTTGQRKRHVQTLETAEGEVSSSLDKLSRRRKIPLQEKMQKPYSFPKDKTLVLLNGRNDITKSSHSSLKSRKTSRRKTILDSAYIISCRDMSQIPTPKDEARPTELFVGLEADDVNMTDIPR
ncbi:hypothetical protein Taro_033429 [Colocasia esculenta]|uniref:Uncharacterized protein n=1 Tax=Colocasia esculenta TaxID=4460 RepID=A0A843W4Q3_COLES|nr:hypothetical protein [Colocasia esculenta]